MSLDKAIIHGKEKRKQYNHYRKDFERGGKPDSRSFDHSCRNHGSCSYCSDRRQFAFRKDAERSRQELEEYLYFGVFED